MDINNQYKIIPIRIKHRARFGIVDKKTNYIVEDANGWGFKTRESALKFFNKKYENDEQNKNK